MELPEHIKRILNHRTVTPENAAVNPTILDSWQRCLEQHQLDPATKHKQPQRVDAVERALRHENNRLLLTVAEEEMMHLHRQIRESQHSIVLADSEGVILNYIKNPNKSNKRPFQGGSMWNEKSSGTNAIGTCLIVKRPLLVHQHDHFFFDYTDLSAAAMPIFDSQRRLAAVLAIYCDWQSVGQYEMMLMSNTALSIEQQLFRHNIHNLSAIHLHPDRTGVLLPDRATITFSDDLLIKGFNRYGGQLLGLDAKDIDCSLPEFLQVDSSLLTEEPSHTHLLEVSGAGKQKLFGILQKPLKKSLSHWLRKHDTTAQKGRKHSSLQSLCFGDPKMEYSINYAERITDSKVPLLLLGETGSGKSQLARAMHQASKRKDKPFIAINCPAISDAVDKQPIAAHIDQPLHEIERQFLRANGGHAFLNEVSDLSMQNQNLVFNMLERQSIPLANGESVQLDIQLMSSSFKDLEQMIQDGLFRKDLYFYLNGGNLILPPLRDRLDLSKLIRHIAAVEAKTTISFTTEAMAALTDYPWPGNIRQLRQTLRILVSICQSECIGLSDLPQEMQPRQRFSRSTPLPPNSLAAAECEAIMSELENSNWNISRAAHRLQVSRNTLYRKIKSYGYTSLPRQRVVKKTRDTSAIN